jgi:hypothetical protein
MSPRDKDRRRIGGRVIGGAVAGGSILLISIGALISIIGGGSDIPSVGAGVLRLDLFAARDISTMPARDSWCSVSRTAEHCWTLQETTGDATDYGSGFWHLTPTGTRRGVVTSVPTVSASDWADYTSELAVWGDGAAASGLFEAGATPSATNVLSVTMIAKPVLDGVLGVLVSHQSTSPPNTGWYIYMAASGAISGVVDYGPGVVNVSSTIDAREAWQCITVVLDARTANQGKVYANGVDVTVGAGNLVAASGGFTATAPFRIHGNQNSSAFASVHGVARVRLDEGHVTTLAEHQAHCGALWQAPAGGRSNNKPLAADASWTQTGGAGCWPTGSEAAVCVPGGLQPYTVDATAVGWPVQEAITNPLLYSTEIDCTNWTCVGSATATPGVVAPDGSATASLLAVSVGANHVEQDIAGAFTADASPLYLGMWFRCSTGTVHPHGSNDGARGDWDIDCSCIGGQWTYLDASHSCVTVNVPFNADSGGNSGLHFDGSTLINGSVWAPTLTEQRPWTRVVIPTWSSSVTLGDPVWSIDNGLANTGSQLLADADCEDSGTSAWTPVNNPTLTKEIGDPHGGLRSLRIAYNGTGNPYVRQSITTTGKIYRCTGWAKGDGSVQPYVYCGTGSASWVGTSSTSWQYYDVTETATGSIVIYQAVTASAGYIEIDDMTVYEQKPFGGYYRAGDMVIQSLTQYSGTCWAPGPFEDGAILLSGSPTCSGTWYGLQVRK